MNPANSFYSVIIFTPQGPAEFKNIRSFAHAKDYLDFVAADGRRIVTSMPYFLQSHATKTDENTIVIAGAA